MLQDLLLPEDFLQFDSFKSTIELCDDNSFFAILGTDNQNIANALQNNTALIIDDLITLKPSIDAIHEILKPYRESKQFIFVNLFSQKNDEFIKDLLFYRDFISDYKLKIIILVQKSHYKNLMKTAIDLYNIATFSYLFLNYEIKLIQEIDTSDLDKLLEEFKSKKGLNKNQKSYYYAEIARLYDNYGEVSKSTNYYNKALALALKLQNKELEFRVKLNLSALHRQNNHFSLAEKYLLEAKKYFKNKSEYLSVLNSLFVLYLHLNTLDKAFIINEEVNDEFKKTQDKYTKLLYLKHSFNLSESENNREKIEYYWNKTYTLANELHDDSILAEIYQYKVIEYQSSLDYKKSLMYAGKSLKLYKKEHNIYMFNRIYYNIAIIYSDLNFLYKAEIYANFCYKYFKINDLKKDLIDVNIILAFIYSKKEDYTYALKKYEKALKFSHELKKYQQIMDILVSISSIYNDKKEYIRALEFLNKAKYLEQKIKSVKYFDMYAEYANTYKNMGEIEKSYEYYHKALESKKELTKNNQIYLDELYGEILMKDNKLEEALIYFDKVLKFSQQKDDLSRILSVEENLGFLYKKMGNKNMSRRFFMEVINTLEVLNIKMKRVERLKKEVD